MKENKMGNHFQNIVNQCLLSAARPKNILYLNANLTSAGLLLLLNEIIPWNSPPPPPKKKKSKY